MQPRASATRIYRHPLAVRLTHWVAALALGLLAMSGMQIFNAHPALYASDASRFDRPALRIGADTAADGTPRGFVEIGPLRLNTTGVLGYGPDGMGGETARAFPSWATIPGFQDLATGRRWHLLWAWVLVICALVYGYWALRLWPSRADLRELPHTLRTHLVPWRLPKSAELNPLQRISYFAIVFVVVPLVVLSGLALSPSVDAHFHWLTAAFGGRQFARLWHFTGMVVLMAFFAGHLLMVGITGAVNNVTSMISGWYRVAPDAHRKRSI